MFNTYDTTVPSALQDVEIPFDIIMNSKKNDFYFVVNGIKTNNLKDINVSIKLNTITAITGISGGGKSSLAYGTLYALCKHHFSMLENGSYDYFDYKIDSFEGALPAVALNQNNFNSNPKSTIYSYLDIPSFLYNSNPENGLELNNNILRINKPGNECRKCNGARFSFRIDENLIIDKNKKLNSNPFKCWSGANLSKNTALLKAFCLSEGINLDKSFLELTVNDQDKLLNQKSKTKFKINFTFAGKKRSREEHYIGPMCFLKELECSSKVSEYTLYKKFSSMHTCQECEGTGIDLEKYNKYQVLDITLAELLTKPISEIALNFRSKNKKAPALEALTSLLNDIESLGLGYLSLCRQIPTLSGGELQKIRFSQISNTRMSGVFFVFDEISSQVSKDSYELLINKMKDICNRGNTIVMVEHNDQFIKSADNIICIGPVPGNKGGYITPYIPYKNQIKSIDNGSKKMEMLSLPAVSKNNLKNLKSSIPINCVTGLCGPSGSGKSSFAIALSEVLENSTYVSQKQMRGNIRSTIATALELSNELAKIYSKLTSMPEECFLLQPGKSGCCPECGGTGVVEFARTFDKTIKIKCHLCNGFMFSDFSNSIVFNGFNINNIYNMPLNELPEYITSKCRKLKNLVITSKALGISHLSIGRKIGNLSGGEARRIKLSQALLTPRKNNILIIDEPGAGLDPITAQKTIEHIRAHSSEFKAILVIDHKKEILEKCDYILEFGPGAGPKGGSIVYQGTPKII